MDYKSPQNLAPDTSLASSDPTALAAQYDSASGASFLFKKHAKSFPISAILHVCVLFTGIFSLLQIVPGSQKMLNK